MLVFCTLPLHSIWSRLKTTSKIILQVHYVCGRLEFATLPRMFAHDFGGAQGRLHI